MKNLMYKILLFFVFSGVFITSIFSQGMMLYKDSCVIVYDRPTIDLRFVLQGNSWNCRYITYFFLNGTNDIAGTEEHDAVRSALNKWASVANIDFIEVCNEEDADIRVSWAEGAFGTTQTFDDSGGALAYGFFPPPIPAGNFAGDIFFDDAEDWALHHHGGIFSHEHYDLETTALQEIGHALGLRHSGIDGGVMEGSYPKEERRELHQDDIDGARAIYGNRIHPISGESLICNQSVKEYTLGEFDCLSANIAVNWDVSPNLILISGQGTGTINVRGNSTSSKGVITVTLSTGCDELIYTKDVCIGKPALPITTPNGYPTVQLCLNEIMTVSISDASCGKNFGTNWWSTGSLTEILNCTGLNCVFEASSYGSGNFYIQTSNKCGLSPIGGGVINVTVEGCKDGSKWPQFRISPNPTDGIIQIVMLTEFYEVGQVKQIRITDQYSNVKMDVQTTDNFVSYDISEYVSGVYYVTILHQNGMSTHTLLKI